MKNVLLLIHDDAAQEARLQTALDVTRAIHGHLTCLDVVVMPALVGDPYAADGGAVLLDLERSREDVHRARIQDRLTGEDVSWDLVEVTGELGPCIRAAAGLADVIVVNRALASLPYPDMGALAGELIVKSGKPILAVPGDVQGFNVAGRAIVAWDGSPASTAALQAATPLLQLAESVIVLEIDDGSIQTSARDAAAYLSRNGIRSLIRFEQPRGRATADILLSEIQDRRADYLVMGGFGHRRWVEAVLGGVTRKMLDESPVPLFLAHD